jgi:hypothetical protein
VRLTNLLLFGLIITVGSAQQGKRPSLQGSTEASITGKLVDAQCHTQPKCRVSDITREFGLILPDQTFLKFDEGGNAKVLDLLRGNDRGRKQLTAKPGRAKRLQVHAAGTRTGDTFNLERIWY